MKCLISILAFLYAVSAQAVETLDELNQNLFYRALLPTIPFHVESENKVDSRLVMVKINRVSYFKGSDGEIMLYGGETKVCNKYRVTGSLSDSERTCLSNEIVSLVRPADYQYSYCVFRTSDQCARSETVNKEYPLNYSVDVVQRKSLSDSFNYANIAFTREVTIEPCKECQVSSN